MSGTPLVDVHAHFYTERSGRADWERVNARRLSAGAQIGITAQVASILGTWGARSPTYFPSPDDLTHANDWMLRFAGEHDGVYAYVAVNPNYARHAEDEIRRAADRGAVGVKLAASRRADAPSVDPIYRLAAEHHFPVLHHIWQHRRREWPGQEASDAVELAAAARRHPETQFILAHIGGGGAWAHSLRAVREVENIWIDLSGSGVDAGMLEAVIETVGAGRVLWGCDVTMDTGLAKLRYLESMGLAAEELDAIRSGAAATLFGPGGLEP